VNLQLLAVVVVFFAKREEDVGIVVVVVVVKSNISLFFPCVGCEGEVDELRFPFKKKKL
jgi:hypothetical protein